MIDPAGYRAYSFPTEWDACMVMRDLLRSRSIQYLELHEGQNTLFVIDRRMVEGLEDIIKRYERGAKQIAGILAGGTPSP